MDFENLTVTRIEELFNTLITLKSDQSEYIIRKELNMSSILNFLNLDNLRMKIKFGKNLNIFKNDNVWTVEKFKVINFNIDMLLKGLLKIFLNLPVIIYGKEKLSQVIKNEFENISKFYNQNKNNFKINKGRKAIFKFNQTLDGESKEEIHDIHYEEWCNIINDNLIIMTIHKNIKVDKNNKKIQFDYLISSDNLNIKINIQDIEKGLFEIYTNLNICNDVCNNLNSELKYVMNLDYKFYEIFTKDKIEGKIISGRITDKINNNKNRTEKHFTKNELEYNYEEYSGEWYEIERNSNNSDYSYGQKYFSNSNNRKYNENWTKTQNQNLIELKVRKDLDDGLGTKTHEESGHKDENSIKIYEYKDVTVEKLNSYVETIKKGFNQHSKWNSKILKIIENNIEINHVENYGNNFKTNEEWFEKWYESNVEKYSFKWGKDSNREWEEEWKELDLDYDRLEKHCYKKCQILSDKYKWYETWNEKYFKNENKVYKYCYKMNENWENGDKKENSWNDWNWIN